MQDDLSPILFILLVYMTLDLSIVEGSVTSQIREGNDDLPSFLSRSCSHDILLAKAFLKKYWNYSANNERLPLVQLLEPINSIRDFQASKEIQELLAKKYILPLSHASYDYFRDFLCKHPFYILRSIMSKHVQARVAKVDVPPPLPRPAAWMRQDPEKQGPQDLLTLPLVKTTARPFILCRSFKNTKQRVNAMRYSPDCKTLACAMSLSTIRLWPLAQDSNHAVSKLIGHTGAIYSTDFSSGSDYLISCSADTTGK